MYVGLSMTYASSFQMFRGAVIVFVAILSMIFLRRSLIIRQWFGILIIVIGLALVGASDMLAGKDNGAHHSTTEVITGDLLILVAQILTAVQMVYEEKFVAGMDIPALQGKKIGLNCTVFPLLIGHIICFLSSCWLRRSLWVCNTWNFVGAILLYPCATTIC